MLSSHRFVSLLVFSSLVVGNAIAQKPIAVWLTSADGSKKLQQQQPILWHSAPSGQTGIAIDDSVTYQSMLGFGHALTGGSADLLMKMSPKARHALLQELFGDRPADIHTTYLRVTIGASDMNEWVYTYDDLREGATDPSLQHFSLVEDERAVIPVLKEILAIQPSLRILASPWTAPAWMKTNNDVKSGALKQEYYQTYAHYFVLYLQAMQRHGIRIAAVTPQNEPENDNNTPSMLMTAKEEAAFIGEHLGPAFAAAGFSTKIIGFDHNCDHPIYPETILRDRVASEYTAGSGFHLYLGNIEALSMLHTQFPKKDIYLTEQMVIPHADPAKQSIAEPVARLIIGAPANWSRTVILWNLAADQQNGPHTANGGCPVCTGALTITGDHVTRLTAYYTVAHASKFVPPASIRIGSTASLGSVAQIAYRTPSGDHVLILSNTTATKQAVDVLFHRRYAHSVLSAGAVETWVW